jgi:hypothetical protein
MPTANELLYVYQRRLSAHLAGVLKWPPELREGVEGFVQKLKALDAKEAVSVVVNEEDRIGRFIRASTGELLWEIKLRRDQDPMSAEI